MIAGAVPQQVSATFRATQALDSLDVYVNHSETFAAKKQQELNNHKRTHKSKTTNELFDEYEYLATEYRHVDLDSALYYATKGAALAAQLNDSVKMHKFNLLMCTVGPIFGLVKESIDRFDSINLETLPQELKIDYFSTADLLYNYARDFYTDSDNKRRYTELGNQAVDSLVKYLDKDSPSYVFYLATSKMNSGGGSEAIDDMIKLLERLPFNDHMYARTAAIIGAAYINDPYHTDDAIYYLARSAMSDIATGNRETTSLHRLGKLLYDKGDIERSYNYLISSLSTAVVSRSRLRSLEIAEALPLVFETVQSREAQARKTFIIVIIVLSALLIATGILFFIYDRNRRRLARMKVRLTAALDLKDNYIRKILSLCSAYLTALDNFSRVAGRKIKAGQITDLLNMIESGKIIREQLETFYEIFDSAFLIIYPDFVPEVNALLQPDKQITLPEGERLTPELRILAFMKLGVDDSSQISKFLGLSLNTVYTYRNKIKMRAINRARFEEDISHIGKIV